MLLQLGRFQAFFSYSIVNKTALTVKRASKHNYSLAWIFVLSISLCFQAIFLSLRKIAMNISYMPHCTRRAFCQLSFPTCYGSNQNIPPQIRISQPSPFPGQTGKEFKAIPGVYFHLTVALLRLFNCTYMEYQNFSCLKQYIYSRESS